MCAWNRPVHPPSTDTPERPDANNEENRDDCGEARSTLLPGHHRVLPKAVYLAIGVAVANAIGRPHHQEHACCSIKVGAAPRSKLASTYAA